MDRTLRWRRARLCGFRGTSGLPTVQPRAFAVSLLLLVLLVAACPGPVLAQPSQVPDKLRLGRSVNGGGPLERGLVGHWIGVRGEGAQVPDLSSHGLHGQLRGGAAWKSDDTRTWLELEGSGSVTVPDSPRLRLQVPFTVAGWFKASEAGARDVTLWGRWDVAARQRSYVVYITPDGRLRFEVDEKGDFSNPSSAASRTVVQPGRWVFVAGVMDGGGMRLYVDGVLESNVSSSIGKVHAGTAPFTIGSGRGGFAGAVRDVTLFNRALSPQEIELLHGGGFRFSVAHTLTYPEEKASVLFESAAPRANEVLTVTAVRDGVSYFARTVQSPRTREEIAIDLPEPHPEGYYEVRVTVVDPQRKVTWFEGSRPVLVRNASKPKDVLYFSFATPRYDRLTDSHLSIIAASPYTSVNAAITGAYSAEPVRLESLLPVARKVKSMSKKVWPLIFLNRVFGTSPATPCGAQSVYWSRETVDRVFSSIKMIDLYDETGSRTGLVENFRAALKVARLSGAPGIFIDGEAYGCRDGQRISTLAAAHGRPAADIIDQLKSIGARIADVTNEEYPEARLFFHAAGFIQRPDDGFRVSQSYILEGIVERAATAKYPLLVIDGQVGIYLYKDLQDARENVKTTLAAIWTWKDRYPANLVFGNRVCPYYNYHSLPRDGWMLRDLKPLAASGELKLFKIEDFEPLLTYLFKACDYSWIYGAEAAGPTSYGYDIYRHDSPPLYNAVVKRAMRNAGL